MEVVMELGIIERQFSKKVSYPWYNVRDLGDGANRGGGAWLRIYPGGVVDGTAVILLGEAVRHVTKVGWGEPIPEKEVDIVLIGAAKSFGNRGSSRGLPIA